MNDPLAMPGPSAAANRPELSASGRAAVTRTPSAVGRQRDVDLSGATPSDDAVHALQVVRAVTRLVAHVRPAGALRIALEDRRYFLAREQTGGIVGEAGIGADPGVVRTLPDRARAGRVVGRTHASAVAAVALGRAGDAFAVLQRSVRPNTRSTDDQAIRVHEAAAISPCFNSRTHLNSGAAVVAGRRCCVLRRCGCLPGRLMTRIGGALGSSSERRSCQISAPSHTEHAR